MKPARLMLVLALLAVGCGDEEETEPVAASPTATATATPTPAATKTPAAKKGSRIVVADSEFGEMLFDSRKQAIYIFENDPKDETVCYDDCAEAWPPVYTDGDPVAGEGVDGSLLGTVKRKDGRTQVTYAGKPLYFYAHEKPGEVRCHNIDLNGGLWWVVGPDGKRRP